MRAFVRVKSRVLIFVVENPGSVTPLISGGSHLPVSSLCKLSEEPMLSGFGGGTCTHVVHLNSLIHT